MWRSNCPTHHESLSTYIHTMQRCAAEFNPSFSGMKIEHKYITGETQFFVCMGSTWNRSFNKWPVIPTQNAHWHFNIQRIQRTLTACTVTENQSYVYSKTNISAVFNSVTISNTHASTCPLAVTILLSLSIQQYNRQTPVMVLGMN